MSENNKESPSFESDIANHITWNLLNLVSHFDFGAKIQENLEDEELGRLGLSCHLALDRLCAELEF